MVVTDNVVVFEDNVDEPRSIQHLFAGKSRATVDIRPLTRPPD